MVFGCAQVVGKALLIDKHERGERMGHTASRTTGIAAGGIRSIVVGLTRVPVHPVLKSGVF